MTIKTGRNDTCPCGSGKKFKHCCSLPGKAPKDVSINSKAPSLPNIDSAIERASMLAGSGRFQEAANICQSLLKITPRNSKVLNLLGIIAFQTGNTNVAIDMIGRAVASNSLYIDGHNNLGAILREAGRSSEAVMSFRKALAINPAHVGALINCANALQDLGQLSDAVKLYRQALSITPNHPPALSNLANALQESNKHEEAVATFQQLLFVNPHYDYAFGSALFSKMHYCEWSSWKLDIEHLVKALEARAKVCKPFDLLAMVDSPQLQLLCASIFAQDKYPDAERTIPQHQFVSRKIRIAYLSADFRQHPVAQLLARLIEQHDRQRFEVWGITFSNDDGSALSQRIRNAFDRMIDVRQMSDSEVAAFLRKEGVDIAIDLMGYTTNSRMGIFAARAAPIQIGFLGFAGTSGARYFDYIIADKVVIPEKASAFYSEKVLYLPDVFQPNEVLASNEDNGLDKMTRGQQGLPEDAVVFCAFNNHYKITPVVFAIWMKLLTQIDGSVLWLSPGNNKMKSNLHREAAKFGIEAERLVFAQRVPKWEDHISRHALADLFLDTWPYNAHTTASDALRGGLPILTYAGESYASRVAASLLHAVGLSELVTSSLESYERLALKLSRDRSILKTLKAKLNENLRSTPLFDSARYCKNFEKTLLGLLGGES